ncbi:MAG: FHA domain-containing protein [Magnetococcales bacterium]|nr:FHA domain-containing protein [Magnetococcales bacterium]
MASRIRIVVPRGETWEEKLDEELTTIGRGEQCQVRINNGTLSRKHATIRRVSAGKYWIKDEGSHNGVVLAGQTIRQETPMDPAQTFWLGEISIRLIVDEEVDATDRMPPEKVGGDEQDFTDRLPKEMAQQPPAPPVVDEHENKTVLYDEGEAEYILEIVSGPQTGASREASNNDLTIGRAAECDLVLGDATVSRKHAVIGMRFGVRTILLHEEASGKLYVNGYSTTSKALNHNDRLRLGKTQILYRLKSPVPVVDAESEQTLRPGQKPPEAPKTRSPLLLAGGGLILLGIVAVGLVKVDPFGWFRSEVAIGLEKMAVLEKKGAFFQAADGYQELLSRQKKLSEEEKILLHEKKGHALLSYAFSLLDGPAPQDAFTSLEESLHSFTLISSSEKRSVEDRIFARLMDLIEKLVANEEVERAQVMVRWMGTFLNRFQEGTDFKKMADRVDRLAKAVKSLQEARQLSTQGRLEDGAKLLEYCLADLAPQDAPCQRGLKEMAKLAYENGQKGLAESQEQKNHAEVIRQLELAVRWDRHNALYQNQLDEAKQKKKQASSDSHTLPRDDGFVVDKFRR